MKSHNFLLIIVSTIVISIILTGCSGTATLPPATETSIPPSETLSIAPVEITPTSLPVSTSVPATSITIADECIPVEENLPSDLVLSGVWLRNEATPYFENLDDHADYIVPFKGGGLFGEYEISPDGKHMAYIDKYYTPENFRIEKRILRVIKSSGHSLDMSYWVQDWQWIIGWVNNQELALYTAQKEVIILNPFTGAWRVFPKPEWLTYDNDPWGFTPLYSPTLQWVLDSHDYNSPTLKDVQTGETILEPDSSSNMKWSSNGSILAIISDFTVYILRNGERTKSVGIRNLGGDYVYGSGLSPDGNKLTFAVTYYSPAYRGELILLDIDKLESRNLCNTDIMPWAMPVWSPDSRFIIQAAQKSWREQFDVLIDVQEMRAYKLISGSYNHRIAWLAKP